MLSPAVMMLGAAACLMVACAIFLFAYGRRRAESDALNEHLQRTIERQAASPSALNDAAAMLAGGVWQTSSTKAAHQWLRRVLQALGVQAWGVQRKMAMALGAASVAWLVLVWWKAGAFLAVIAWLVFALLTIFFFWKRLEKKRQKMLEQLPGFIDNMVRLITIGTSPQAAFQMSVINVPLPLAEALQQASAVLSASSNLGYAMEQLEDTWRIPEFGLLAAVFRMSTKYGGRTDLVLERVASYIRDKHSAERELHALSAEVRLSAWVLSLLPLVVGTLIMVINDGYFLRMWNDPGGRQMIFAAAGLELAGVALLYRLAKLR